MPVPIPTNAPYGATPRGFQQKNVFADIGRLLGPETAVVFDVGAHAGEEAATFRGLFPSATIHCFEPTMDRARSLSDAFAGDPQVQVHQLALADRDGQATFFNNPADATNSLLPFCKAAERTIPQEFLAPVRNSIVNCATVTTICGRLGIAGVDLLKLDVQGAERRVLEGASSLLQAKSVRLLYAEVAFVPVYEHQTDADDLCLWLKGFGYRVYDFYNFAYAESGQLLWGDAIFLPT
jgi:FkbM family methyltransferase